MRTYKITYSCDNSVKHVSRGNGDINLFIRDENGRKTLTIKPKKDIRLHRYEEELDYFPSSRNLFFMNGYQSWTDTREFNFFEREKNIKRLRLSNRLFSFDRYGDATFYRYNGAIVHGYDVFYSRGKKEKFLLNLNYKNSYLVIQIRKVTRKLRLTSDFNDITIKKGNEFVVADYYVSDSISEGMEFFNNVFPAKETEKVFGYTSWYNYYQNINEGIILRDLEGLDDRFNLFQIDDGYETKVGDWLSVDANKFPNGLEPVVEAVHRKGKKAGIWLAPFVAEKESALFKERPGWFKKDKKGNFVICGSNWSGFYALDLKNPEVLEYINSCLKHYADMGFDFFKLDFLYAANLSLYDNETRSMSAERAYSFLRTCLEGKAILGCGATVFNCIDKFDYLRVGPDVSLEFDDVFYMRIMHRERISTKVTLQNTIFRSFFNDRLFGNDPDVFLLRDDNIKLNAAQRKALITINALFGNVLMTSDNLAEYDEKKRKLLSDSLKLFYDAVVLDYKRTGDLIHITYEMDGNKHSVKYNTNRGVLT